MYNHNMRQKRRGKTNGHNYISDEEFLNAIKGSAGILKVIAMRLGCKYLIAKNGIHAEGRENLYEAFQAEKETVGDLAEGVLIRAMEDNDNPELAVKTAQWYLDRKHTDRGYGRQQMQISQDGERPIEIEGVIDFEKVDIPLDDRKKLLAKINDKVDNADKS